MRSDVSFKRRTLLIILGLSLDFDYLLINKGGRAWVKTLSTA